MATTVMAETRDSDRDADLIRLLDNSQLTAKSLSVKIL